MVIGLYTEGGALSYNSLPPFDEPVMTMLIERLKVKYNYLINLGEGEQLIYRAVLNF
jgi:hypothetical protein